MARVNIKQASVLFAMVIGLGIDGATASKAAVLTFDYVHIGSGANLDGTLTAVVKDVAANQVEITMNSDMPNSGFVSSWAFNLVSTFTDYANLSNDAGTVTGGATLPDTVDLGPANSYDINGAAIGGFDIGFTWAGSNHGFDLVSSVTYVLTYSGSQTFNAISFDALSAPGYSYGPFYSAAKVQGIDPGNKSGEVGNPNGPVVPEPSSIALMGLGGVCALLRNRFRCRESST